MEPSWKQSDVFPIIARMIEQAFREYPRFMTAREIAARNFGFSPNELRRLQKRVIHHQAAFLEAWHGHFGADG